MRSYFFLFVIVLSSYIYGQHPRNQFGGKNFVLHGETEIVLKNGEKIKCDNKIDGTKIGKTDINYEDVDYIRLIKTSLSGYSNLNGRDYKYISIKNKPQLVQVIEESPKLSFYAGRSKMTGGGFDVSGAFQYYGTTSDIFMIKNGDKNARKVDFGKNYKNVAKLFPECPQIAQFKKKENPFSLSPIQMIVDIYNRECSDVSINTTK